MSFGENWSYSNSINWKNNYQIGNKQSPINIDKNETQICDLLCQINLLYNPSNCILTVKNRTPIIYFSDGSYLKHQATNDILSLKAMTIHTPSLHSMNGRKYDMEIVLYHKFAGGLSNKSQNFIEGGTAVSLLFEKGSDHGKINNFLNTFIYKIPTDVDNMEKNVDIKVDKDWGANMLLPELKSYFYYEGSLPFPPCEENWKWIVFEEIQGVSSHILDVLNLAFKNNIRSLKPLGTRKVSYNSNIDIESDAELEKKADEMNTYNEEDYEPVIKGEISMVNKDIIKIILTFILIILTLYASLKMVKYIVSNDLLNKMLIPTLYLEQLKKSAASTVTA